MFFKIKDLKAFQLLDSRGFPTVGVHISLYDGSKGFAMVPSGASTGAYEAVFLRDNDKKEYMGKGVKQAVENITQIIFPEIEKNGPFSQKSLDEFLINLDATADKSKLGGNAMLGVSLAFARAAAASLKIPLYAYLGGINAKALPVPMMNILNGGAHAANNIDIQEFMIVPCGITDFDERIRAGSEIYQTLGKLLGENGYATAVGDEGGFAPNLESEENALDFICAAIEQAGYNFNEVKIALDMASSEWATPDGYFLPKKKELLQSDSLVQRIENLCNQYPIMSVEDGMGEDDTEGWKILSSTLGNKIMLVGDDLFVTDEKRIENAAKEKIANSVLIKPNQIGTLSETLGAINTAVKLGYKPVISHRSGDTEDSFIADLSVAVNAPFIKTGAPCRSERTAKYNRLMLINREI